MRSWLSLARDVGQTALVVGAVVSAVAAAMWRLWAVPEVESIVARGTSSVAQQVAYIAARTAAGDTAALRAISQHGMAYGPLPK